MTNEQWQKVNSILSKALELEGEARVPFIEQCCEADEEIKLKVEALLDSESKMGDFIETPVFQIRPDDSQTLTEGQCIGVYQIEREIGRGGMAIVYLAQRSDGLKVAIKVLRRSMATAEIARRFSSERRILSLLKHKYIANLLEGGRAEDGRLYFVMEYVEGRPIDEYCDTYSLSIRQRLELFREVCSAVHFAHQNLIVHRDLKPGNILVTEAGGPKLLDFGIAELLDRDHLPELTRAEYLPMTPAYASPEQIRGEIITTASDVYSLGVLLYVLLTGHHPHKAGPEESPPRLSNVICRSERLRQPNGSKSKRTPESVSQARRSGVRALHRELAGDLEEIVFKAMDQNPNRRYISVDYFAADITRYLLALPVLARKWTWRYRTAKFFCRLKGRVVRILLPIISSFTLYRWYI